MSHLMIVDDDVEFAGNLAAILRKGGHEVTVLNTTERAVQAIGRCGADLAIVDVMFPDNPAAGFELVRLIRHTRALQRLPILLLTSVNQEFPMDFSAKDIDPAWMPVQDFLEKPVKSAVLLRKIAKLLKK